MNNFKTRFKSLLNEDGNSIAEIAVAAVIFSMFIVLYLSSTAGTAKAVTDFNNKHIGQHQGGAMDTAREITDTAFLWVSTHTTAGSDTSFTRADLLTFSPCEKERVLTGAISEGCDETPYLDIPDGYVWSAGSYFDRPESICAVVYQPDAPEGSENAEYTALKPAMWDRTAKNFSYVNACTTKDDDGNVVPRWGEVQTAFTR